MILAVVGLPGAGKSAATHFLVEHGFHNVYLGQPVMDELRRRELARTEKNERVVRRELREEYGMAAMAKLLLPRIKEYSAQGDVVLESMYSWSEYRLLKAAFPAQFRVLAVHASPRVRKQRMRLRDERPLEPEELESRDFDQIERLEQAGPIARADFHVVNEGSKEDLFEQLRGLIVSAS
jgi:dephospho-CoA kinase